MAWSKVGHFSVAAALLIWGAGTFAAGPLGSGGPMPFGESEPRFRCVAAAAWSPQVTAPGDDWQKLEDELEASCVPRELWPWR